ncbi:conserved repeat domain-containing protein/Por secretion system C-terminal sorting domain-containing protein [Dyadobacter sp. SG02]|uniref:T9SS type A sorting domain-containing protein n=1 Tax=Dyadobacter sp. SG02 TaxID=1855291 RepID=UPI0008D29006|nr:T9SS type A sorting domain-containing protein [Dyadobacter sp. SG02]SEJ59576.1 conserved repeat domain-containing protein/Por secretion system C-terminal sorting domain-containing protein [Dyadobacter sp. SG02]
MRLESTFEQSTQHSPRRRSGLRSILILAIAVFCGLSSAFGEGSGAWGVTANRQANLYVPTTSNSGGGNTGYKTRGFMMLPSNTSSYNPAHRMYVWVKANETVFYGFRSSANSEINVHWYYDNSSTGFYPTATSSPNRILIKSDDISQGSGGATGRPSNASAAATGPNQVTGNGYTAYSFKNTTGSDRAFWIEIEQTGAEFNFWDVTVASGSSGNYTRKNGRLYCKYWSIVNDLPTNAGVAGATSSPSDFGFYIPIDNTYTPANDFYVKYANFGGSGSGYAIFFANLDGPLSDQGFAKNRRSMTGSSSNAHFPLFLGNPDASVWPSPPLPIADFQAVFSRRPGSVPAAGQASFTVNIDNPSIVDILIDLNGNGYYDGKDVIISNEYNAAGTYQIYWNGKDNTGTDVPTGTAIHFVSSLLFYPVHFPIYDMEQSLGVTIKHVRPLRSGTQPINDKLYWDDTDIARENLSGGTLSPRSVKVNVTGVLGPEHIWWANGDNGFSQNNTINTWTGAYNDEIVRELLFNYTSDVDLAVTKSVSPDVAKVGETVTFTIQATNVPLPANAGNPITATGVIVTDEIPDGYDVTNVDVSKGSWSAGTNTWLIGTLAENEVVTMTVTAKVNATGPYLNTAVVQGNENDENQTNNTDDATPTVKFPQPPDSYDRTTSIARPTVDQVIALNGIGDNPPLFAGIDEEDGTYTGKTGSITNPQGVIITSLPTNGELYYGGSLVTQNEVDTKRVFPDPAEFTIKFTGSGYVNTSFEYAYVDSEGMTDPSPATYLLTWEGALPVTLAGFEAVLEENRVRLSWKTAEETNASHFDVERSTDAKTWNKIAETAAIGDSRELSSYTAIDGTPLSGISYYRLKTVDRDDTFAYSRTVSVNLGKTGAGIRVYPNPAAHVLHINGVDAKSVSYVSLVNMNGQIVAQFGSLPENGIDLSRYANGIYLIKIITKDGLQTARKIAINK